jgi:predicted phosphodiesterase
MIDLVRWPCLVVAVGFACAADEAPVESAPDPMVDGPRREPTPVLPPPAVVEGAPSKAWSFAVLSDLHLPNPRARTVDLTVAALIEMKVRLVIITGDHTNGAERDGRFMLVDDWYNTITAALLPLREAGIAVLPVAGNHDTYLQWQREGYREAFLDLDKWAEPFTLNARRGRGIAQPPFAYSLDVDGVHFSLAHIVGQYVDRDTAEWLADDLAASARASHRLVFGHVPAVSVIRPPNERFVKQFTPILERGKADFYIAGHEHIFWDETFALPAGGWLRQVTVGCASGYYNYAPTEASKARAGCVKQTRAGTRDLMKCQMPNGGAFEIARNKRGRQIQHYLNVFSLFTVDGDEITVTPMTVDDDGRPRAFYLPE